MKTSRLPRLLVQLSLADFRQLVAGRRITQYPEDVPVEVELHLETIGRPPDPPEAREFLARPKRKTT